MDENMIKRLYAQISNQRRLQFKLLLFVTVLASFAEIVSLGAVVPFIAVVTQPEKIFYYPFVTEFASIFGITTPQNLVGPIALLFVAAGIFAGILRIIVLYASIRFSNSTGADLSAEMYRRTLHQPYLVHISRSSSDIISGITQKVATATSVIAALVTVITSTVLFIAIFTEVLRHTISVRGYPSDIETSSWNAKDYLRWLCFCMDSI
jgi:ATP-binding cassette subfamily B protein